MIQTLFGQSTIPSPWIVGSPVLSIAHGVEIDCPSVLRALTHAFDALPSSNQIIPLTALDQPFEPKQRDVAHIAQRITELLFDDPQLYFLPKCSNDYIQSIFATICDAVLEDRPIDLVAMWGCIKHYASQGERGIDLAEIFGLFQLRSLHQRIQTFYAPGVFVTFFLEDFGVWYEDAYNFDDAQAKSIVLDLTTYSDEFSKACVAIVPQSRVTHLRQVVCNEYSEQQLLKMAITYTELLENYWHQSTSSASIGNDILQQLSVFGWHGHIPPEMREHYLSRLTSLYPGGSYEQKVHRICRYFAVVLMYQNVSLIPRLRMNPTCESVKISMYKPSPGILTERINNRLHMRVLPKRLQSTINPPWTCRGVCKQAIDGSIKPALMSFKDPALKLPTTKHYRSSLVTATGACSFHATQLF